MAYACNVNSDLPCVETKAPYVYFKADDGSNHETDARQMTKYPYVSFAFAVLPSSGQRWPDGR